MSIELVIVKELANIGVTLTELSSIARTVTSEIRRGEFAKLFTEMVAELAKCYDVVDDNISPLVELDSELDFVANFDVRHADYKARYLKEISKPRTYVDDAYETYLTLKTLRESKTSYPLLKRTFGRLDEFVDKWVTNDAWLAMSIDTLFKMLHRLLNEVAEVKQKDPSDAYLIYHAALSDFDGYLALIRDKRGLLDEIIDMPETNPALAL